MGPLNKSATANSEKKDLTELLKSAQSLQNLGIKEIPVKPEELKPEKQKKWIFDLLDMMEHTIYTMGTINEEDPIFEKEYKPFKDHLLGTYHWDRETTEEDIQIGNKVLDAVIEYCKQKLQQYDTS